MGGRRLRAVARDAIDRAAIDTGGFRFGKVLDIQDVKFPGGARYGDLPGMIALGAPAKLWLAGEGDQAPRLVKEFYAAAGAAKSLTLFHGEQPQACEAAVQWLLAKAKE